MTPSTCVRGGAKTQLMLEEVPKFMSDIGMELPCQVAPFLALLA